MKKKNLFIFMAAAIIGFFACSESNDQDKINGDGSATGTLKIQLTDAPFPTDLVSEANVVINKIEIRRSGDSEGDKFVTLSEEEMKFNLLELRNGVTASLIDLKIDTGSYDLIRLYVAESGIKLKDGSEHKLKVPSGEQTGIKIFIEPSIKVVGGLSTDLLLDFVVSESFVLKGNMDSPAGIKGFNFKPVIKASNLSTAGTLSGNVYDVVADTVIPGVQVSIIAADTVYSSSFTNENGDYSILGVDAGTYKVVYEKEGFEALTNENIVIDAANITENDAALTAIVETTETTTETESVSGE